MSAAYEYSDRPNDEDAFEIRVHVIDYDGESIHYESQEMYAFILN